MQPIIKSKDKGLSIAVFDKGSYFTVCLQRSYKKKGESEYTRETINLFADDLPKLALLANKVYVDILNQKPAPANEEKTVWDGSIMTDNDEIPFD